MNELDKHSIDYAKEGAVRPVDTRIRVEERPDYIRFTDPPGSNPVVGWYKTIALICGAVAFLSPLSSLVNRHSHDQWFSYVVGAIFAFGAYQAWIRARDFATLPTIIEVSAKGLSVTHPKSGFHEWTRQQVKDICCDAPIPGRDGGALNALAIVAGGQRCTIMNSRPFDEIQWLIAQLKQALERDWGSIDAKPG